MPEINAAAYSQLIDLMWEKNKANHALAAKAIFSKHNLPPAASVLIPNLSELLAQLQKSAFYHGALTALYSVFESEDDETNPQCAATPVQRKTDSVQ